MTVVPAAALAGAALAAGLLLLVHGARRLPRPDRRTARRQVAGRRPATVAAAALAGVLAGVATGWPVAAVAVGAVVWWLPAVWGTGRAEKHARDRVEAVATWAEMLRDTLSAAAGLEQTILATAALAPPAIRTDVTALAGAVRGGARLPAALAAFADELAEPTTDLVVAALLHAAQHQSAHLGERLGVLAAAARERATAAARVTAERARTRAAVRIIVALTVVMVGGLVVFNRGFLTPYSGPTGQVVLAVVAGIFAAGFAWLHRLSRLPTPPRVLTPTEPAEPS